ncbi:RodZ domain-containing protein [Salinispira pacifica]
MESIGDKLRNTREGRGYTLEQVARDTHIAKRFLTALESEEFAMFPGEPYLLGFLRNYAEYLGLSAQEMVSLYKNLKLQEQPVPMDELLEKPAPRTPIIIGVAIVVVAALGLGAFLIFGGRGAAAPAAKRTAPSTETAQPAAPKPQTTSGQDYTFQGGMKEQSFKRGDAITVQSKGKEYRLLLTDIGSTVTLSTPTGVVELVPNVEKLVDLSGDGRADIRLLVRSISTADTTPSAVIRLDTSVEGAIAAGPAPVAPGTAPAAPGSATPAPAPAPAAPEVPPAAPQQPGAATTAGNGTVITTADQTAPFTVDVAFTNAALFRYSVDNGQRQERYYQAGERFTATASNRFELWLSNAGAVQLVVSGNPVTLGTAGEVAADLIQWNAAAGSYRLELVPIN